MSTTHNHLLFLQIPQDVPRAADADRWALLGLQHLLGVELGTRAQCEAFQPTVEEEELKG